MDGSEEATHPGADNIAAPIYDGAERAVLGRGRADLYGAHGRCGRITGGRRHTHAPALDQKTILTLITSLHTCRRKYLPRIYKRTKLFVE